MTLCPACGEPNPARASFCLACGTPLPPPALAVRPARKTVTVVFTDVAESGGLGERLDPESLSLVMASWFDHMRALFERHGARVQKFVGDAVVAVSGIPVVNEDDALRAVRAAPELQASLDELNQRLERDWGVRLRARSGVNTGEVVTGDPAIGDALVLGDAVNVAARLEQAAPPGEVLLGQPTLRLVRDAVEVEPVPPLRLKGKQAPVAAWRLFGVTPGAPGHTRRQDAPIVGRQPELRLFAWVYERLSTTAACHLLTVLGQAGVGKTRLVAEAVRLAAPTDMLTTRGDALLDQAAVALAAGRDGDAAAADAALELYLAKGNRPGAARARAAAAATRQATFTPAADA